MLAALGFFFLNTSHYFTALLVPAANDSAPHRIKPASSHFPLWLALVGGGRPFARGWTGRWASGDYQRISLTLSRTNTGLKHAVVPLVVAVFFSCLPGGTPFLPVVGLNPRWEILIAFEESEGREPN